MITILDEATPAPPHEPRRAIVVLARFRDGTRRVRVCETVEEVRRFVAGEQMVTGAGRWATELGQGREEGRADITYTTSAELAAAVRSLIA